LARQGYSFLATKASQGTEVPAHRTLSAAMFTGRMVSWIDQARQAGMVPGLYHWLTRIDGAAQARFFHNLVRRAGGPAGMLIQLDCEDDGYGPQMAAWAAEWDRLTGGHPFLIYSGSWWWPRTGGYRGASLTPYLWHSHYLDADTDTIPDDPQAFAGRVPASWWQVGYGGWTTPTFVQFSSRGDAGSLGNNVDLNAFRGTTADMQVLLGGTDVITVVDQDAIAKAVVAQLCRSEPFTSKGVGEWATAAGWAPVSSRALLEYIWHQLMTRGVPADLLARLDAILAAASDDANPTVVLAPEHVATLAALGQALADLRGGLAAGAAAELAALD
jgi:GH25 family lysozyme M1 (1,4-beta-N-acetylmuramidase)